MQWLIPVATAVWAVWTWAHDHEKERQRERTRMAALYVSPFLSACEELQSRIYMILEVGGGLNALRQRYSDGTYAEETLYLLVRFFGWSAAVTRYGPYTQDPKVIGLVMSIRRAFSASGAQCPVGPFNFFIPEQKALGKMVMHCVEGQYGNALDTISFYEFKDLLASRPLVDKGWLSTSRLVGKSGKAVKPKMYLALGISGAPEHAEAITGSDMIVAVNTDPNAPIFDIAQYGVEMDMMELLPALLEKLEQEKVN